MISLSREQLWWPCWALRKGQWVVIPRISIMPGHPNHTCRVSEQVALDWAAKHAKGLL